MIARAALPGVVGAIVLACAAACGRGAAAGNGGVGADAATGARKESDGRTPGGAMGAREAAAWEAARGGDAEELMRLADLVGCDELEAAAADARLRGTAIAAMAYCRDFTELPWLAKLGAEGGDEEARAALESAAQLAARPRRSTDPDDAQELHEGCQGMLGLARDTSKARERRALAVRSLRMLAEYGCVRGQEVPTDLDAK